MDLKRKRRWKQAQKCRIVPIYELEKKTEKEEEGMLLLQLAGGGDEDKDKQQQQQQQLDIPGLVSIPLQEQHSQSPALLPTSLVPYAYRTPLVCRLLLRRYKDSRKFNQPPASSFETLHALSNTNTTIPFEKSFACRLYGSPHFRYSLAYPLSRISDWTGKPILPYIWKDLVSRPPRLRLMLEIKLHRQFLDNRLQQQQRQQDITVSEAAAVAGSTNITNNKVDASSYTPIAPLIDYEEPPISIDYVPFHRIHLEQVNEALSQQFWPGIDVSESLLYPDYSIVALYRRVVVGCAFMMPECYITYFMVRPGWQRSGIGRFMLFYLTQVSGNKDITLHVSANNPAMLLYQEFGFKPEGYIVGFYDKYLPPDSKECKHAFVVRLRR